MDPLQPTRCICEPQDDDIPTLELILITVALVASSVLAIAPSPRVRAQTNHRPSVLFTTVPLFFACVSLGTSAVALTLGWLRRISLDALGTTVFALVPALVKMPTDTLHFVRIRRKMATYRSLAVSESDFRAATIRAPCGVDPNAQHWEQNFGTCLGPECGATMYIRYFPRGRRFPLAWKEQASASNQQWTGVRIGHTQHCVFLREQFSRSKRRWWRAVWWATWMVAKPSTVYLNNKNQVLGTLCLLSDLMAIGNIVHRCRGEYFERMTRKESVKRGMTRRVGLVCNTVLQELGMVEWGTVGDETRAETFKYPEEYHRRYGLMFYVLALEGNVFERADTVAKRSHGQYDESSRMSAQIVLDQLAEADGSREAFERLVVELIDDWLVSWGCDRAEVQGWS